MQEIGFHFMAPLLRVPCNLEECLVAIGVFGPVFPSVSYTRWTAGPTSPLELTLESGYRGLPLRGESYSWLWWTSEASPALRGYAECYSGSSKISLIA